MAREKENTLSSSSSGSSSSSSARQEGSSIREQLRSKLADDALYERYEFLLSDKDLWALMLIEFSPELAELTQQVSVEERLTVEEKVQVPVESKDERRIREGIAGMLNKAPSKLTEADYKNVTELNLSGASISDLTFLNKLESLQTLDLTGTMVTDQSIKTLSDLTNLQRLYLAGTQVSDIGALFGLANLQKLYLRSTKVSDIGALSGLTNLQALDLEGTQVSDICALSGLTNLQRLDLNDTQVSDEQVAKLKKALPKLEIFRRK